MPIRKSNRRLTSSLTLAACLLALAAALLGPAQTLAQTHKASCAATAAHAKDGRGTRACGRSTHGDKGHRHGKRHSKHSLAKAPQQGVPATLPSAYCEDGSAPVRSGDGSFACVDGSEPECEDGAEPTRSSNGKSLVCAILAGGEEDEGQEGESECEEGSLFCSTATIPGASEQSCEASASESSSFVCEREG